MHGKRPTEFIKVMHFALSGKSGDPINMQTLQPREGLYLLQIPDQAIPVRRFVWDAFSVILSGIELNEEEFFIRDYLYIPLGGNRCSTPRMYCNLAFSFFCCGLWHGAKMTFV